MTASGADSDILGGSVNDGLWSRASDGRLITSDAALADVADTHGAKRPRSQMPITHTIERAFSLNGQRGSDAPTRSDGSDALSGKGGRAEMTVYERLTV